MCDVVAQFGVFAVYGVDGEVGECRGEAREGYGGGFGGHCGSGLRGILF
jgi:hypothetical protein